MAARLRRQLTLEVAVFCGDEDEKLAGELWQTIDLRLTAETYQRALKEGWRTWPACRSPGSRGISK